MAEASYAGVGGKASTTEIITLILFFVGIIVVILWYLKRKALGIIPSKKETVDTISKGYLGAVPMPNPDWRTQQGIQQGVEQRFEALSPVNQELVQIGTPIVGDTGIQARQRIVNALTPLSFSYGSGYVEAYMDSWSWYTKLTRGLTYQNSSQQEIQAALGKEFQDWLVANYDEYGNKK